MRCPQGWSLSLGVNLHPRGELGPRGWTSFIATAASKRDRLFFHKPVFNNMSLLSGVNLDPRGELCPKGGMVTPLFIPRVENSQLFRRMEGRTEDRHPWGTDNFTPQDQSSPLRLILNFASRGKLWPPGAKFSPRSELCPLGVKFSVYSSILLSSRECPTMARFTPRGKVHPWGQTMLLKWPLGAMVANATGSKQDEV
jgi:hypothetical protein